MSLIRIELSQITLKLAFYCTCTFFWGSLLHFYVSTCSIGGSPVIGPVVGLAGAR